MDSSPFCYAFSKKPIYLSWYLFLQLLMILLWWNLLFMLYYLRVLKQKMLACIHFNLLRPKVRGGLDFVFLWSSVTFDRDQLFYLMEPPALASALQQKCWQTSNFITMQVYLTKRTITYPLTETRAPDGRCHIHEICQVVFFKNHSISVRWQTKQIHKLPCSIQSNSN